MPSINYDCYISCNMLLSGSKFDKQARTEGKRPGQLDGTFCLPESLQPKMTTPSHPNLIAEHSDTTVRNCLTRAAVPHEDFNTMLLNLHVCKTEYSPCSQDHLAICALCHKHGDAADQMFFFQLICYCITAAHRGCHSTPALVSLNTTTCRS